MVTRRSHISALALICVLHACRRERIDATRDPPRTPGLAAEEDAAFRVAEAGPARDGSLVDGDIQEALDANLHFLRARCGSIAKSKGIKTARVWIGVRSDGTVESVYQQSAEPFAQCLFEAICELNFRLSEDGGQQWATITFL